MAIILLATSNVSAATLYVAERYNGNIDAIDTVTGEGRIVASGLGGLIGATVDRRGRLFVHRFDAGAVALVDAVNSSFVDIATGIYGHGLCADPNSDTLYLAGYDTHLVYRITEQEPDNWQVDVVSSGLIQPIGVYLQGQLLYVADRGGFLYAQQLDAGPPEIVVALPSGGEIIDREAWGDLIIGTKSQDVYQVDIVTRQIVRTFGGFANPAGLVVDPTDNSVLVCEHDGHRITRLNLETGARTTLTEFVETPYQPVFAKDSICSGSNQPPTIRSQPIGQTNYIGETARLSVFAAGTCPLSHQWRKRGLDLVGATNAALVLASATVAATGDYTVVVANAFGSVTSAVAQVTFTERSWPYVEEFRGSVGREWSQRQTDVTPMGNRRFLGQFGNDTVSLTLNGLPPHQEVTVSFDLFVINTWDGNSTWAGPDLWDLNVAGGPTLLHSTFRIYPHDTPATQAFPSDFPGAENPSRTGAVENDTLGYPLSGGDSGDCVYHLKFTFPHAADAVAINFSASGLQDIGDESWGLDNVMVTLTPAEPPNKPPAAEITVSPLAAFPGVTNLVVIAPNGASAEVVLDGSLSSDVDNDPLEYWWTEGPTPIATDRIATKVLGVGSHTLTLVVSDGLDTGTNNVTVEIVTPVQSVGILMALVEESDLPRQRQRPLLVTLSAAATAFEQGNSIAGQNQLHAFQNKVQAQVRQSDLVLVGQLTASAQVIMDALMSEPSTGKPPVPKPSINSRFDSTNVAE